MVKELSLRVDPATAATELKLLNVVSTELDIDANRIGGIVVTRRSIDARQRRVMINLGVKVFIDEPAAELEAPVKVDYRPVADDAPTAIVVGAGPAGLFAALRLIEEGVRPLVFERGKDVDSRRVDLAKITREQRVNPESNYCFGEGGAGAYSDGKLYTRSKKRGSVDKILSVLYLHGASADILVDAHPHIGTDRLPDVIKAMRKTIERCGGRVCFETRIDSLTVEGQEVIGVVTERGEQFTGPVVLATGHSARDIYRYLHTAGIKIEPKGIAIGVRLEHPQEIIDRVRYHCSGNRGKFLPPAEYTLSTRVDRRGVYSFCMCPGGFIIPAASGEGQLVVNGMSPSNRGTRWANAGMVVEVLPEDIPAEFEPMGDLKVMGYQEMIERRFWEDADKTQNAPAQRMTDFVAGRPSRDLPRSSYAPGIHPARVDRLLPTEISRRLQAGFKEFGAKNRGFLTGEAVVIGDETRTSSPVRIPRDNDTLQHVELAGLYPAGEGAGYAGGIVSAAIDGDRCAAALAEAIRLKASKSAEQ
ncbi:MAG: FAD-binding protein [Muribaculaceae bacterium]|nr:FAD-binding protein [Muribaculaceae bacterium]